MAVIDDLVERIEDVELKKRIQIELQKLTKQKKFGLVFESHLPECTPLYEIAVTPGRDVAKRTGPINEIWTVLQINGNTALCRRKNGQTIQEFPIDELVAVASFGEPIYPYLKPIDSICNAPESDLWHTLIEADNYHALQLLEYLYAGKVDCIYIDPPYNTGAKDWKYNNNYVDSNDAYRHSKWLSFMEKRLRLAKTLLNPKNSALIVTIDEKEYLHLGCLLEEIFPNANVCMVSSIINPHGVPHAGDFTRVNEYIFFIRFGECLVNKEDISTATKQNSINEVRWLMFRRTNIANVRTSRPSQFYPIYVNTKTHIIEEVGDPIPHEQNRFTVKDRIGCVTVFPVRDDGTELLWGVTPNECRRRLSKGYLRSGKYYPNKPQQFAIQYLPANTITSIENGEAEIIGRRSDNSVIAIYKSEKKVLPKNQWAKPSHDAMVYGTQLLSSIIGSKKFDFPKSLYAVKDCLNFVLSDKKNALVVDFFAGSGTTLHAINLLNSEDNGNRRCILITNNEVYEKEAKILMSEGVRPGEDKWNALGIARYVTWPRTVCSIKGVDINKQELKGEYLNGHAFSEGFKTNVFFCQLCFSDKVSISLGSQFWNLLPLLWMKAGAFGPCPAKTELPSIPQLLLYPTNKMAVLIDTAFFSELKKALENDKEIRTVFLVTDNERSYQSMISELDVDNAYQLYRDYLDNFRINQNRG